MYCILLCFYSKKAFLSGYFKIIKLYSINYVNRRIMQYLICVFVASDQLSLTVELCWSGWIREGKADGGSWW